MFDEENILKRIVHKLTVMHQEIDSLSKLGLTDANIVAEDFLRDLFNLVYNESHFINLNDKKKNFPAIDLFDEINNTPYQITSRNDPKKIKETIKKFKSNNDINTFNGLKIFIIGKKKKYSSKFELKTSNWEFSNQDILDIDDLISDIKNLSFSNKKKVDSFLNERFDLFRNKISSPKNRLKKLKLFFLFVLVIVVVVSVYNKTIPSLYDKKQNSKTFPAKKDPLKYNIAVLPFFDFESENKTGLGVKITERLQELKVEDTLNIGVDFFDIHKDNNFNINRVRTFYDSLGYDLIIYGDVISGNCNIKDRICVNYINLKLSTKNELSYSSTSRKKDKYLNASVDDIMEGKLQAGFEAIIYYFEAIIAHYKADNIRALRLIQEINNDEIQDPFIENLKSDIFWASHDYEKCLASQIYSAEYFLNRGDTLNASIQYAKAGGTAFQLNKNKKQQKLYSLVYSLIKPNIRERESFYLITLTNLSRIRLINGDTTLALVGFNEMLDSLDIWNDPSLTYHKAEIYFSLAKIYVKKRHLKLANEYIFKGKYICDNIISEKYKEEKISCYSNLADFSFLRNDHETALIYLSNATKLLEGTYDEKRIYNINLQYDKSYSLLHLKRFNEADSVIQLGLNLLNKYYPSNPLEIQFKMSRARIYYEKKEYAKSLELLIDIKKLDKEKLFIDLVDNFIKRVKNEM